MTDPNQRLAREFPSLAKELLGTGPAAPAPQQQAAAPPPSPPSTPTPSVNRLAKEFPSLAAELLGQKPPAQRQEAAPKLADVTAAAPLELEAPEGLDAQSPVFGEFRQLAGEFGLSGEQAGKVLALYQRDRQEQDRAREAEVAGWRQELASDAEVQAGREDLHAFLAGDGGRELAEALGDLGDSPPIIRALIRLARAARRGGGW